MFTPFSTIITRAHLQALAAARIFPYGKGRKGSFLKVRARITFRHPVFCEPYSSPRRVFLSLGAFGFSRSALVQSAQVGRYCSIANDVQVLSINHPLDRVSTNGWSYGARPYNAAAIRDLGPYEHQPWKNSAPKIGVGSDVWIGSEVRLARQVNIGHGAVIGACALVTKDVEAYAIMGGVPARIIRFRFDEPLREKLLASRWWEFAFPSFDGIDVTQVERFVDEVLEAEATGRIKRWNPEPVAIHDLFRGGTLRAADPDEEDDD